MAPSRWHRRQQRLLRRLPRASCGPSQVWHRCINASCHEVGEGRREVSCPNFAAGRCFLSCFSSRLPHTLKPKQTNVPLLDPGHLEMPSRHA